MYKIGEYEKAYNVSLKLLNDFPYLEEDAHRLNAQSKKKWNEEYLRTNPPKISIDSAPDPNRITRHDLIKQTETRQKSHYSREKQPQESTKPVYKYWHSHPKMRTIPEPK